MLATTVVFAQAASEAVKHFIERPRPEVVPHLDMVYSTSFPSGHALMSPVVYLTLAGILASNQITSAEKRLLIGGAALLVIAIGISRLYLGVHWPTDVLAGWFLGSAIAVTALAALHLAAGSEYRAVKQCDLPVGSAHRRANSPTIQSDDL